jgi:hypothetical protein
MEISAKRTIWIKFACQRRKRVWKNEIRYESHLLDIVLILTRDSPEIPMVCSRSPS